MTRSVQPRGQGRLHPRVTSAGSVLARHSLAILVGGGLLLMLVLSQLGENGIVSWFHLVSREKQLRDEVADLEQENRELTDAAGSLAERPGGPGKNRPRRARTCGGPTKKS